MQKMQRYFGFRVKVSDFLEPTDYRLIRNKLREMVEQGRLDLSVYRIYLHQLALEADTTHFGVSGGIEGRIDKILLRFSINPKQRRTGDIQFANNLFKKELNEENRPFYLQHEVGYTIPSSFFRDRDWFQNVLVTLVRHGVREDHKKIKIRVAAEANAAYVERLKRNEYANSETSIDMNFERAIDFNRQIPLFDEHPDHPTLSGEFPMAPKSKVKSGKTVIKVKGAVTGGMQVGTVDSTQTISTTVGSNPELLEHVLKELKILQAQLHTESPSSAAPKDLAVIDGIVAEAPRNPEALSRLKTVGRWLLTRTEKVGLTLLASILKDELSL